MLDIISQKKLLHGKLLLLTFSRLDFYLVSFRYSTITKYATYYNKPFIFLLVVISCIDPKQFTLLVKSRNSFLEIYLRI